MYTYISTVVDGYVINKILTCAQKLQIESILKWGQIIYGDLRVGIFFLFIFISLFLRIYLPLGFQML